MFTLGDVADILDDALDMGINIVEALHKLAEAGDKGKVTREECLAQLDLSGESRKSLKDDGEIAPRNNAIEEVGATAFPGEYEESMQEDFADEWLRNYSTESNQNKERRVDRHSLVESADAFSMNGSLKSLNTKEISPLKIYSSNVKIEEDDVDLRCGDICDEDDYYDSPLQKYKSKRWSNTFALNLEKDDFSPHSTTKVADSASRQSSCSFASSDDGKNYLSSPEREEFYFDGENMPAVKRKRRNTYSIELTPRDEAEEKGLPIIDALDDLCSMADQLMNGQWVKENNSPGSPVYREYTTGYCSGEDEVSHAASNAVDEKIFALDEQTAKAYKTFTDVASIDREYHKDRQEFETREDDFTSGSNINEIVDQKIADIGNQAEMVLKSFRMLKDLKQYENGKEKMEYSSRKNVSHFDNFYESELNQVQELDRKSFNEVGMHDDFSVIGDRSQVNSRPLQRKQIADKDELKIAYPDLKTFYPSSDKVEEIEVEIPEAFGENDKFSEVYNGVEENLPCEFQTVKNVQYEYIESNWTTLSNNTKHFNTINTDNNANENKRPGTYVLHGLKPNTSNSVYEEPVFITANKISSNSDNSAENSENISCIKNVVEDEKHTKFGICDKELQRNRSKNGRPGTYVLAKLTQDIAIDVDFHDGNTKENEIYFSEENQRINSQENVEKTTRNEKKRPGTYVLNETVLKRFDSGSQREVEMYKNDDVIKKEEEEDQRMSNQSSKMKKRPGTYSLEKSSTSFVRENERNSLSKPSWKNQNDEEAVGSHPNDLALTTLSKARKLERKSRKQFKKVEDDEVCFGSGDHKDGKRFMKKKAKADVIGPEKSRGIECENVFGLTYEDDDGKVYRSDELTCGKSNKKAIRPGTYVLTNSAVGNEFSEDEIKLVGLRGCENFENESNEVDVENMEALKRKRPGTYTLNDGTFFRPIATKEILIDAEVEDINVTPIEKVKERDDDGLQYLCKEHPSGNSRDLSSNRSVDLDGDTNADQSIQISKEIKRASKPRKARPSTYKIDQAFSNLSQTYDVTNKNGTDIIRPSDSFRQSNLTGSCDVRVEKDTVSEKLVTRHFEIPAACFKTVSNVALRKSDVGSITSGKEVKEELSEDDSGGRFESRQSAPHSLKSEEDLAVTESSVPYVWKVSEKTLVSSSVYNLKAENVAKSAESVAENEALNERYGGVIDSKNDDDDVAENLRRKEDLKVSYNNYFNEEASAVSVYEELSQSSVGDIELSKEDFTVNDPIETDVLSIQQIGGDFVKNKSFDSIEVKPKYENQDLEFLGRVVRRDWFLGSQDYKSVNGNAISCSEKPPEMTTMKLELNNNDPKAVEKDFSSKSDYSEMADECAVLSTHVQIHCCPDEGFHNGTAGVNLAKEPVLAREGDPRERKEGASASLRTGSCDQGEDCRASKTENERNEQHVIKDAPTGKESSVLDAADQPKITDNAYGQVRNECYENFVNNDVTVITKTTNGCETEGLEFASPAIQQMKLDAFEGDEESMKAGRIAVKLEIDFSDLSEGNRPSLRSKGAYAEEIDKEGRDVDEEEILLNEKDGDDVDNENIKLRLKIDKPKYPEDDANKGPSQGISFDINLGDGNKKITSPPGNLKKRLTVKTRSKGKAIDRPGTYVLNSPIFSRDEYEDEREFEKCFTRRSLGSSDGADLNDEIRKAVREGRLELNLESSKYDNRRQEKESQKTDHDDDHEVFRTRNQISMRSGNTEISERRREDKRESKHSPQQSKLEIHTVDERCDENLVGKSAERSKRPGTYVLQVAEDVRVSPANDGVEIGTQYPDKQVDEGDDYKKEDIEYSEGVSKRSLRPGTYVLQDSTVEDDDTRKRNTSLNQLHSLNNSPQVEDRRRILNEKREPDQRAKTFAKFRNSFESQRTGFFVDLKNGDSDLDGKDAKETGVEGDVFNLQSAASNRNYQNVSIDNDMKTECFDLRLEEPKKSVKALSAEPNANANVCSGNEIESKSSTTKIINYSSEQLKDEAISMQDHSDFHNSVKRNKSLHERGIWYCEADSARDESINITRRHDIEGTEAKSPSIGDNDHASNNKESEFMEKRTSLPFEIENEKKQRINSWEIKPDTKKEVLGKITSLKDSSLSKYEGRHEDSADVDVKMAEGKRYFVDVETEKKKEEYHERSAEKSCNTGEFSTEQGRDSPSQKLRKQAEYFIVDYDSLVVEEETGGDWKSGRDEKGKRSSRKSDYFVIGEEFNAEEVRIKRRSGEKDLKKEASSNEVKEVKVKRKNTFVLRPANSSEKNNEEMTNKEVNEVCSSAADNIDETLRDFEYGSCVDAKIPNERTDFYELCHATIQSPLLKPGESSQSKSADVPESDQRYVGKGRDETISEDFDLYVSNGSRPASGISENQSSESTNDNHGSGEIQSRRSSALSSSEDLTLQDANHLIKDSGNAETFSSVHEMRLKAHQDDKPGYSRYQVEEGPVLENITFKRIDRQLSDTIVSVSHRVTKNDNEMIESAGARMQGSIQLLGRQLSENIVKEKALIGNDDLVNNRVSASMPNIDNDLTIMPFKLQRTRQGQNFGHRPMSYDISRKPLLERLERLCMFMSKSLTKLNNMNKGDSEIYSKLDKKNGREDLFLGRKASSSLTCDEEDDAAGYVDGEDWEGGRGRANFQSTLESVDEVQVERNDGVRLRESKSRTPRGRTYVIHSDDGSVSNNVNKRPEVSDEKEVNNSSGRSIQLKEKIADFHSGRSSHDAPWKAQKQKGLLMPNVRIGNIVEVALILV